MGKTSTGLSAHIKPEFQDHKCRGPSTSLQPMNHF